MGKIFDALGQVTQKQIVRSDPKSNSFEILCLSLLPISLKKIQLELVFMKHYAPNICLPLKITWKQCCFTIKNAKVGKGR